MAQLQKKLRSVCLTAKKANFTEVSLINEAINTVHWVKTDEEKRQKNWFFLKFIFKIRLFVLILNWNFCQF